MTVLLWTSLLVVGFAYAGYPLVMALIAWLRPLPIQTGDITPSIDVLLVVHNGASWVAAKQHNLLALDYPHERLRIHIVCDGCTDNTEALLRANAHPLVHIHAFAERGGKSASIGKVLPLLNNELVLFTDVRQRLDVQAARALAAVFADTTVGAASGELVLENATGYGKGIDAYWRYEKLIRRIESSSGSLVGVTGALYAARRTALPEVPAGLVLDDMWIPLCIAKKGLRVVFVPVARAFDQAAADAQAEQHRKRRTLAGNFQLLHRWPQLAIPGAHPLAWRLWGHKWLRLLAPWLLLTAYISNAVLALHNPLYVSLFIAQSFGYALVALGRWFPATLALVPVRLASAFFTLNLSAARALIDYLCKRDGHLWQVTHLEKASQ
ncbi:MAG: family 2 glycosyl transferase [Gammaproteobacteria bacterium HGW-Gammaproteobacteria-2]|jgi:cellulose synthase/poly-beta-1,6-N-acetylglucosamine synthase-like glycosyltransferase|nr:MAG: family 2 glycosyl transferase [Gammaproteobacteria bacterium HGW-Gammaproteobacteria-2]